MVIDLKPNENTWTHRCPYYSCNEIFFKRPEYDKHIKVAHANDKSLKVMKCGFKHCSKIFLKKDDYNSHMINKHKVLQAKKPVFAMVAT